MVYLTGDQRETKQRVLYRNSVKCCMVLLFISLRTGYRRNHHNRGMYSSFAISSMNLRIEERCVLPLFLFLRLRFEDTHTLLVPVFFLSRFLILCKFSEISILKKVKCLNCSVSCQGNIYNFASFRLRMNHV